MLSCCSTEHLTAVWNTHKLVCGRRAAYSFVKPPIRAESLAALFRRLDELWKLTGSSALARKFEKAQKRPVARVRALDEACKAFKRKDTKLLVVLARRYIAKHRTVDSARVLRYIQTYLFSAARQASLAGRESVPFEAWWYVAATETIIVGNSPPMSASTLSELLHRALLVAARLEGPDYTLRSDQIADASFNEICAAWNAYLGELLPKLVFRNQAMADQAMQVLLFPLQHCFRRHDIKPLFCYDASTGVVHASAVPPPEV